MIIYNKKENKILILLPMGEEARKIIRFLQKKGLVVDYKPMFCG